MAYHSIHIAFIMRSRIRIRLRLRICIRITIIVISSIRSGRIIIIVLAIAYHSVSTSWYIIAHHNIS